MQLDIATREMHEDGRGREQPETCGSSAYPSTLVRVAGKQRRHGNDTSLSGAMNETIACHEAENGDADGVKPEQDEDAAMAGLPRRLWQRSTLRKGGT